MNFKTRLFLVFFRCQGGWLYLEGGGRVCGADERFGPPVVLFSDNPTPVLHME